MVTKLSPCNWLVLLGLSVLTNTIHLVEFHGEFRIQLAYRQPFFYIGGPHPPEHGYQWVNDACQLNLFALPVCHQRHGELKLLHFFKNDHDKSSHQLSLRFQRHRCSPELDECQMGRRRRCYGRFVFGKCAVSQESYPLGIKASVTRQGFHQCWLPFVSRVVSLATHRTSAVGDE